MKKIFYLLILIVVFIPRVYAATWTDKKPVYTSSATEQGYLEGDVTFVDNAWGDISGWESPYYYDSGFVKNITWRYDGEPFLGNDWTIKGQIFTTTESGNSFFKNVSYSIYILTDYGTESCLVEYGGYAGRSGNYTTFQCSGTSTNRMQVVLNVGEYDMNATYFLLRSDWSQVTTDLSNGSMVGSIDNSINESEQNIINNQNENSQNEINNANQNQEQTNERLDEANKTSKGIWGTIKEVLSNIITLPMKIVELLIEALKNLFVPTDEQLYEIINDSKDLTENFGFVGESVNFFIEIFTSLLGMVNGNGCLEFPAFKIGSTSLFPEHTFWEARQVCLNDNVILSNNINTIRTITSIVLVGLFLNFASSKFFSILSKNDNERANADVGDMNGVVK